VVAICDFGRIRPWTRHEHGGSAEKPKVLKKAFYQGVYGIAAHGFAEMIVKLINP
jgi:hypothetical protein